MFLSPSELFPARNIISLVPSQTELLHYLGGDVAGITKFCIHPSEWFRTKPRVGGTKQIHPAKIEALAPGLIIANLEENVKDQVEYLAEKFPVWVTDVNTLEDALQMIMDMGKVTGNIEDAFNLSSEIRQNFNSLDFRALHPAAYLIWKDPYMVAGGGTFINDMLKYAGFRNVFGNVPRYPEVTLEDLHNSEARYILLSSEPYPFRQKHLDELSGKLPGKKILLVDGEMFSWYGSRLLKSAACFNQLQQHIGSHVF